MADSYLLQAGAARARFSAQGAQCQLWQIGERHMLWPGDAQIWPAIAPVLFPTCGWSREGQVRIGERLYPMPVHGFAAQSSFVVEKLDDMSLRFTLIADAQTRLHYPFAFRLVLTYCLMPSALALTFEITNHDEQNMPYAVGLHPGFALNWAQGPHRFVFDEDELAEVPIIAPGGLFSDSRRPVPLQGRSLALTPDLFAAEALCFLNVQSRGFALEGPEGRLRIEAPDFPHLVLWNQQAAPFLAIESWTGTGDQQGFEGSFFERPSMIHLEPGASRKHHVRYAWEPLGSARPSP